MLRISLDRRTDIKYDSHPTKTNISNTETRGKVGSNIYIYDFELFVDHVESPPPSFTTIRIRASNNGRSKVSTCQTPMFVRHET